MNIKQKNHSQQNRNTKLKRALPTADTYLKEKFKFNITERRLNK